MTIPATSQHDRFRLICRPNPKEADLFDRDESFHSLQGLGPIRIWRADATLRIFKMLELLPVELWEYRLRDFGAALISRLRQSPREENLSLPELGECIPTRSARAAIVTAIQAIGLTPDARVGVPLYCCSVVFKAIEAAGCKPRFLDVEPGTFCLSATDLKEKKSQIDAVIAVHMYGNVCDVPKLREVAPGLPVIEDCALSLGSKLGDRMTGSLGDIGVFSFRSGKYLSVGEGGAIFSSNGGLRSEAAKRISRLPVPGPMEELVARGENLPAVLPSQQTSLWTGGLRLMGSV